MARLRESVRAIATDSERRVVEMPLSNSAQEMLWVESWNDLYDLVAKEGVLLFIDAEWNEIALDEAQEEIQNQAYESRTVHFERIRYRGKRALRLTFSCMDEENPS